MGRLLREGGEFLCSSCGEGTGISLRDVIDWWNMAYPSDIFVNPEAGFAEEIAQIRDLMNQIREKYPYGH